MPNPPPVRPDPAVIKVLREYRQALDAREDSLMTEMARRWLQIQAGLESDITALAYEMEKRREDGRAITEQMVWRAERYQKIQGQLDDQIKLYNREYAVSAIARAQEDNALLGISAANDAIAASYAQASALGPMWNRINLGAVQAMIGFAGDGSPLNKLLKASYPDAVDGLMKALINGMARGLGPAQIAKDMSTGTGLGLDRALLIARTEVARSFRTASTEQYRKSGVVSGFYRLVKKATACMACLMLDGQKLELADELEDHPRGKCQSCPAVLGVSKPRWETGPEWFKTLSPDEQREKMGPEKYELYAKGKVKLSDFARMSHSDVWGSAPRVATLAELTGG